MNWWDWLTYDPKDPMLFTAVRFWIFFGIILLFYQFSASRISIRNFILLVASLYFYYLSSGFYFFLLIFSTLIDFYIGKKIYESDHERIRKRLVTLSVIINLLVLGYFKYTFFFAESYNYWADQLNTSLGYELLNDDFTPVNVLAQFLNFFGTNLDTASIFLPVGISFFTFQTISYSIDIYRGHVTPTRNIIDFAFYVSFFPQLVAGPIVRAANFVPQIYQQFRLTHQEFGMAVFLILAGLTKKMMISDYIAPNFVDRVFEDPGKYTGFENLFAVYGYSIQIYCDFSGYTDIAIGVALLLGFRLPLNFNSPYKATSITDFWRRWHISLSSWLRDYLYIPLGGNRKGKMRTYINLFLTMFLGGLWHGADVRFLIWGGLHGVALAIHKVYMEIFGKSKLPGKSPFITQILWGLFTFHFVAFCWIFFRASDVGDIPAMAIISTMLTQISTNFGEAELILRILVAKWHLFAVILLGFVVHLVPNSWKREAALWFTDLPDFAKAGIVVLVALVLFQFVSADNQPFIYFQF